MSFELLAGLISLSGIIIGALPTYLFMRKRNTVELDKLGAETEKIKAETEKIRAELLSSIKNGIGTKYSIYFPHEFNLSFTARRESLSQGQGNILRFFSTKSYAGQFVSQDVLEKNFNYYNPGELYYRIEHLRLLGFLDRQKSGQDENGVDRYYYQLSALYRKELGNPEDIVSIFAST